MTTTIPAPSPYIVLIEYREPSWELRARVGARVRRHTVTVAARDGASASSRAIEELLATRRLSSVGWAFDVVRALVIPAATAANGGGGG